jgi:hypothetical protein
MQSVEDEFVIDRYSSNDPSLGGSKNMPPVMQSSYFNPNLPPIKTPHLKVPEAAIELASLKTKQLSHQDLLFSKRSNRSPSGSHTSK